MPGVLFVAVFALLLAVSGCTMHGEPRRVGPMPERNAPEPEVDPGDVVAAADQEVLVPGEALDRIARADVVYVGESHTSVRDHHVQAEVLRGLLDRGRSVTMAMEMFPRGAQPVLNRWSDGLMDVRSFQDEVQWSRVWGYPFALYRELFETARDNGVPVVGANAPRDVVAAIAEGGYESLTPAQRAAVADTFFRDDAAHRAHLREMYEAHPHGRADDFERFYDAQLAWEETMAETVAQLVQEGGSNSTVLMIAGAGHVAQRFGIPERVLRRVDHDYALVLPVGEQFYEQHGPFEPKWADYLWITDEPLENRRLRVGVGLSPVDSGIEVRFVAPDSPADKAGLRKGDVLTAINGAPVEDMGAMHGALEPGGGEHVFTVLRDGSTTDVVVDLPPSPHGKRGEGD
ncbi:MAG: ChaN family lipoprotein [Desulfatibacillaceae bacterium]